MKDLTQTNGDVIKAAFPNVAIEKTTYKGFEMYEVWFDGFLVRFRAEWWNHPYNKEVLRGEWISYIEEFCDPDSFTRMIHHRVRECSICHSKIVGFSGLLKHCPNCGKEMKGDDT